MFPGRALNLAPNNNNNTIYIVPIKSEDTEALGDAGLSRTKQMCL